ncbi:lycopene cyclase domain-containing protein [Microbacteriaceae bacterium SG_E_30_P1]|uniref:Lycopene cyclase domain-containing protein n=1 Tax=Antiquaquibacter oligotrophicus TaxID=2880260 RepID=A0ABT6KRJ8_9MICO|nr:lycopene cyclase domain-containing protein [Antiquaquibacter oligotrophicus]MDH6182471.1 lycopene cyclase domain-containing protein [Antiquaquibacter oligotrophicus]UDF14559.1 lycopene cyclase domain-containing protein [Antiquaquibacter oligotrophicus]
MGILYLVALGIALTGMVMLDRRFRLFFWADGRRAAIVLVVGVLFFLAWDLAGVGLGVFFRGETSFMTGLQVAPEVPLEEVFFLTLLCYLTMNVYRAVELRAKDISGRRDASAEARPGPGSDGSSP